MGVREAAMSCTMSMALHACVMKWPCMQKTEVFSKARPLACACVKIPTPGGAFSVDVRAGSCSALALARLKFNGRCTHVHMYVQHTMHGMYVHGITAAIELQIKPGPRR